MSDRLAMELEPADTLRLANLCGQFDEHLKQIESRLGVEIFCRGNLFTLQGPERTCRAADRLLQGLYRLSATEVLTPEVINLHLQESGIAELGDVEGQPDIDDEVSVKTKRGIIRGRGPNQRNYLKNIMRHAINFGVGPAGTGKTYLAVACAVPGDMAQKVDPYLRPLYDALYEMQGFERVATLIERNVIEVAPLAFMRGRTLNDAFVILDEAQNTTREQMKMFLTRIGFGSTAVVTGDITQIDLPSKSMSGLIHALKILDDVKGVSFSYFSARDVVRHPMVQHIVEAYGRESDSSDDN